MPGPGRGAAWHGWPLWPGHLSLQPCPAQVPDQRPHGASGTLQRHLAAREPPLRRGLPDPRQARVQHLLPRAARRLQANPAGACARRGVGRRRAPPGLLARAGVLRTRECRNGPLLPLTRWKTLTPSEITIYTHHTQYTRHTHIHNRYTTRTVHTHTHTTSAYARTPHTLLTHLHTHAAHTPHTHTGGAATVSQLGNSPFRFKGEASWGDSDGPWALVARLGRVLCT